MMSRIGKAQTVIASLNKADTSATPATENNVLTNHVSSEDVEKELDKHTADNVDSQEEETTESETCFSKWIEKIEAGIGGFLNENRSGIKLTIYVILLVLYLCYVGYCMYYRFGDEGSIVLVVITVFFLLKICFKVMDSRGIHVGLPRNVHSFLHTKSGLRFRKGLRLSSYIAAIVAVITYLALDVFPDSPTNIQSFLGMLALIIFCFIFSAKPSRVNWHPVFWAFAIQFAVAFVTLRTQVGYNMFKWLGDLIRQFFSYSDAGSTLVVGKSFKDWGLSLSTSGVIIFTNACIALLNHWGVIEFVVLKIGGFLAFCLDTGPVESVVASANIFIGLTEAPLLVRPYLPTVTKSELHTIITCGFASISGGVMALFIQLGAPANHLLTAAVISAPAALATSKLMYPETERIALESQTSIRMVDETKEKNALNAFSEGAVMGVRICAAVWGNMLAFVSILSLMDALAEWFGDRAGVDGLTFSLMCSYLLFPLAYVMGVERSDCRKVGELIGVKLFANPVLGYQQLGFLIQNRKVWTDYMLSSNDTSWHWDGDDIFLEASNTTLKGGFISERTEVIATYAMCGYSAFSAIGICLGALVPLCPSRGQDIINIIIRAFVAGNMASFATGAIAGVMY